MGAADHASLVPASLRARIQGLGQGPRTVQLAGHPAWRYRGLVGRGKDEALDVTVLPGRDAVLSVACVSSVRDALAAPDCAAAITSVSLGGAPTLVPAPDLALRQQLPRWSPRWIAPASRREPRSAPPTPAGTQARWARRLEAAHVSAADALRPMAADSGAPLIEALSVSARAYRALARTAGAPSASRFRQAQREVQASDARLAGAVDAVAQRPVVIAAAPARSPAPEVASASAPGWLLPAIVLSALLVGGLVTLALRRPALRPPSRPQEHAAPPRRPAPVPPGRAQEHAAPPRRPAPPPPGRPQEHTTPPRRPAPPPPGRPQEHAAPPDVRHPLTAGRWDASPTPGPESVDDPRRSGAAAI